jgi:CubicO group peptidase (beta-lactamase class C family)
VITAERQQTGVRLYRGECDTMKQNGRILSFKKLLMLSCLLLAPTAAGTAQQSPIPGLATKQPADQCRQCGQIDALVAGEFAESRMGSLTAGVVFGDTLVWTKSYGNADSERSLPANQDTAYRIGSITKMFTATMLEQLVEAGKVNLNDPVEKYFPEVNRVPQRYKDAPPITLLQLATHTSGLSREPDHTAAYVTGKPEDWKETLIAALPHVHYESKPGTRFLYSNIGYAILGAALEQAAAQPYLEYLPQSIFTPLGMTHTSLVLTPEMQSHLAKGYEKTLMGSASSAESDLENRAGRGYKVPNGAMYTTVDDLAKFASFLMGKGPADVLAPSRLLLYQDRYVASTGAPVHLKMTVLWPALQVQGIDGYGLGIMAIQRGRYTAEGHGGSVSGFSAGLYVNRAAGVAVIVLSSANGNGAVDVRELALRALDLLSK